MPIVRFSVLSYYPSFITEENINIGILFYISNINKAIFCATKNWDRVRAFDDELNINFMKDYLKGVSYEIESTLFNFNSVFDIEGFVKYYVNEYKFSTVQSIECENADTFIEETKKIYLKFDYDKTERLTKNQEHQYIYKLLRSSDIEYSREKVKGFFDENIQYDYIIGEYAIKFFTFEGKSLLRLISSAKIWAYNALEMQPKYKTIFIYDKEEKDVAYFSAIIDILSKNAYKVMIFQEGIDYLLTLKSFSQIKQDSKELAISFNN